MMSDMHLLKLGSGWESDPLKSVPVCSPSRESLLSLQNSGIYKSISSKKTQERVDYVVQKLDTFDAFHDKISYLEELDPFVKKALFEEQQMIGSDAQIADYRRGREQGSQAKLPSQLRGQAQFSEGYLVGIQDFTATRGLLIPRVPHMNSTYGLETITTDEGFQGFRLGMNWERPSFAENKCSTIHDFLEFQLKHFQEPTRTESGYQIGFQVKALRDYDVLLSRDDVPLDPDAFRGFEKGRSLYSNTGLSYVSLGNFRFESVGRKFASLPK